MIEAARATEPGLDAIAMEVATRTGLALTVFASDALERAARTVMADHRIASFEQLALGLQRDGRYWDALVDELTVGETYFFRDPGHFELVRTRLLPALRELREQEHVLRIWSAGCATGEEAYSLAMLLDGEGLLEQARVYGSDISRGALREARLARYRDWSLRGLDPRIAARWMERTDGVTRVHERVARAVTFRQLNLAGDGYALALEDVPAFDLIFCRNVLMYFSAPTIRAVEARLFDALAPGGYLIAGPSDPLLGNCAPFEVTVTEHGLCYRRPLAGGPVVIEEPELEPVSAAAVEPARPALRAIPPESELTARELATVVRKTWRELGVSAGLHVCERAIARERMLAELHHLHALLLLELGNDAHALQAARRALYLQRDFAIAQFTLASILERVGRRADAARMYRNLQEALSARPADELVPSGDGIRTSGLAAAASEALVRLKGRADV